MLDARELTNEIMNELTNITAVKDINTLQPSDMWYIIASALVKHIRENAEIVKCEGKLRIQ